MPRNSGPAATLSSALRQGNRASVWKTKPISRLMHLTGWPMPRTWPALAGARPVTRLSVVDLPQPVGPTTQANAPRPTVMLKSCKAVSIWPLGVTKRLVTSINSIAAEADRGGATWDAADWADELMDDEVDTGMHLKNRDIRVPVTAPGWVSDYCAEPTCLAAVLTYSVVKVLARSICLSCRFLLNAFRTASTVCGPSAGITPSGVNITLPPASAFT